jgi:acyl-CoA synthetase (AMP-forming)/AMP-acid ligase II
MGASQATTFKVPPTEHETAAHKSEYSSSGPFCSTDKTFVADIRMSKKGAAALRPCTVGQKFKEAAQKCPYGNAYKIEKPCPAFGKEPRVLPVDKWFTVTYEKYYTDCRRVARAFLDLGIKRFDAVNIYGFNSPEWFMGTFGAILAGGVVAGVYPTDTPEQVYFKARHSGSSIALVEGDKQAKIFLDYAEKLPKLKAIVQWTGEVEPR